jgi:glycerate kinase
VTGRPLVVCLDKFRGSATAVQACHWLAEGVREADPTRPVLERPIADGGEGTVDALVAAGYQRVTRQVPGPLGEPVAADLAVRGDRAVVELAQASGLHHVRPTPATALAATTRGTGALIAAALDLGCRDLVLAVGGSATTDGGAGLLQALGARLLPEGTDLARAARLDLTGLDPRLRDARFTLASDVDNPLLGPHGAAAVFAPQKGAGPDEVARLEAGLTRCAALVAAATGADHSDAAGAGAAGGAGFAALAVLGATRVSGADFLLAELGLDDVLRDAAGVVVGEGAFDAQTLHGKAPVRAAALAAAHGVPVVAVAGRIAVSAADLAAHGITAAHDLLTVAGDQRTAMAEAERLLRQVGRRVGADL